MTDKRIIDNQRYNAERRAQAELMKRDLDRDQVLAKIYQEGYDRIQAQIDQFYMSYAGQNGLTKQEAVKRVSDFDVTKFNEKAARAVKERDFSSETNAWLKTYNLKMRVSRLELLKAELALEIQNLTAETNEVFDKARRDEQLAEFKRQAGILGNSATGAKKRLEAILDADFYGQTFSARVWGGLGLRATLQRDVFGSLNRIYTDMMGYRQERDRLAKKFGTSRANAQRLLKTEIARINSDTQLAMLKDNDFTHMIFVAEPGACDLCGPLDQKAIPIDEVEKGRNMFPMHPNCRCSAYGHIKLDRKDGTSTLDEYDVWGSGKQSSEQSEQEQIAGEGRKLLEISKGKVYNQDDKDSHYWADVVLTKVRETEPDITQNLGEIVNQNNGRLEGLEFRFKELDSLARKIEQWSLLDEISLEKASTDIHDALRYTVIFDGEKFGQNYSAMKDLLRAEGFNVKNIKNTWLHEGPYKGVNTILEKDGTVFEVQYHTPESFELKNGKLHELYEEYRLGTTAHERKLELEQEMLKLSQNLTVPNGIEGVE